MMWPALPDRASKARFLAGLAIVALLLGFGVTLAMCRAGII